MSVDERNVGKALTDGLNETVEWEKDDLAWHTALDQCLDVYLKLPRMQPRTDDNPQGFRWWNRDAKRHRELAQEFRQVIADADDENKSTGDIYIILYSQLQDLIKEKPISRRRFLPFAKPSRLAKILEIAQEHYPIQSVMSLDQEVTEKERAAAAKKMQDEGVEALRGDLENKKQEIKRLEAEKEDLITTRSNLQSSLQMEKQKSIEKQQEIARLQSYIDNDLKKAKENLSEVTEAHKQSKNEIEKLKKNQKEFEEKYKELEQSRQQLASDKEQQIKKIQEGFNSQLATLQKELNNAKATNEKQKEELSKQKEISEKLLEQNGLLAEDNTAKAEELAKMKKTAADLANEKGQQQSEILTLKAQNAELIQEKKQLQKENKVLQQKVDALVLFSRAIWDHFINFMQDATVSMHKSYRHEGSTDGEYTDSEYTDGLTYKKLTTEHKDIDHTSWDDLPNDLQNQLSSSKELLESTEVFKPSVSSKVTDGVGSVAKAFGDSLSTVFSGSPLTPRKPPTSEEKKGAGKQPEEDDKNAKASGDYLGNVLDDSEGVFSGSLFGTVSEYFRSSSSPTG